MGLAMDPTDPDHSYTTQVISAANGVFYAGAFFGTVSIAWPAEKWGRLRAFQIGALFHILGGILQSAAVNVPMVCPS
jgi:MFS family permease